MLLLVILNQCLVMILPFNCFVAKQCILEHLFWNNTIQAEVNGIEWCSSPVVCVCGLCQVVAAGLEGSCELTDYYWIPDGLSVCHQHTCRSRVGMGKRQPTPPNLFPLFSLITDVRVSLSASFPPLTQFSLSLFLLQWPSYIFCICVINTQDL